MSQQPFRADRVHAVFTNGDKPLAQRKIAKLAVTAALVCSAAFAGQSHASGWFSNMVNNASANHYTSSQALQGGEVTEGVVEMVQRIRIKNAHPSTMGTIIGSAVGGALGYTVTQHSHNYTVRGLGTLLGTTLGAGMGRAASQMGNGSEGIRIIVRVPEGYGRYRHEVFVQADDQPGIQPGATVALLHENGQIRVTPIDSQVGQTIVQDQNPGYQGQNQGYQGTRYGSSSGYRSSSNTRYIGDDGYDERTQQVQDTIRRGYRP